MAAINIDNEFKTFYYINVFLKQTQKNLGQFSTIKNNQIIGDLKELPSFYFENQTQNTINQSTSETVKITGLTKSRLNEVKTYQGLFKVGVNGVTFVNEDYIIYQIDEISYTTFIEDNLTIYSVTKTTNEFENQSVIRDDNSVSVDVKKTLNAFLIDRSNISVYDYFNKINNCNNLDDLLDIF
jgi:hypothetical protein